MFAILVLSSLLVLYSVDCCNVEVALPKLPVHEREGAPRASGLGKLIPKLIPSAAPAGSNVVLCYYGSWSGYQSSSNQLSIENIDPSLCTHLVYAFAGLDSDSKIKSLNPSVDLNINSGKAGYRRFNELKKSNPNLKTLIGIGGWNEGSIRYSALASNSTARRIFASSVVSFLDNYKFNGIDLDWEFPAARGGSTADKGGYIELLRDLASALKPRGYLMTASVSPNKLTIDAGYNVAKIAEYVDLINVMTFDYRGGWEGKTGHHAPLYRRPDDSGIDAVSNVNYTIHYWLEKGAPRSKLVLGLAMFGRSFVLKNNEDCSLDVKVGKQGTDDVEAGSFAYKDICSSQKTNKWIIKREANQLAPYGCQGELFVGYDDPESIAYKVRFAKVHGLAGVMIWLLENDDFSGNCFGVKFPLVKAVLDELKSSNTSLPTPSVILPKPDTGHWTPATLSTTDRPWSWTYSTAPTMSGTKSTPKQVWTTSHSHSTTSPWWPSQSTTQVFGSPSTWWPTPSTTRGLGSSSTWWPTSSSTVSPSTWWPQPSSTTSFEGHSIGPVTSSTSRPKINPTAGVDKGLSCKYPGTFIHPTDCRKFYRCVRVSIEEKYKIYEYDCPPNTLFDVNSRNCLWDYLVDDCRDQRKRHR